MLPQALDQRIDVGNFRFARDRRGQDRLDAGLLQALGEVVPGPVLLQSARAKHDASATAKRTCKGTKLGAAAPAEHDARRGEEVIRGDHKDISIYTMGNPQESLRSSWGLGAMNLMRKEEMAGWRQG